MRRRRKRTRLRPKPVLILLLTASIGVGLWWSPITSIRSVRVEGADPADQQRLAEIVAKLQGIPNARINPAQFEAEALQIPSVRYASLSRGLFGSALLEVRYRTPVAKLLGHPGVALSEDGVFYKAHAIPAELPQVQLPSNGPPTLLTLAANWRPQTMANLAQEALKLGLKGVIRIQVEEGGSLCLNSDSGRVILGSLEDLDKKLDALRERIAAHPDELSQVKELNLTAPDSPSVVPKEENPR